MPSFDHETVPNYLRSKPELDVEKKIKSHSEKFTNYNPDQLNKMINNFNKTLTQVTTAINNKRDEWRNEEGVLYTYLL